MPSALAYTWPETTDLIVTAQTLLPGSSSSISSAPQSVFLRSTRRRKNTHTQSRKQGDTHLNLQTLYLYQHVDFTICHGLPAPASLEAINNKKPHEKRANKKQMRCWESRDVFGFGPESHATDRKPHTHTHTPASNGGHPLPLPPSPLIWSTTSRMVGSCAGRVVCFHPSFYEH